jgi:hypothetical protein
MQKAADWVLDGPVMEDAGDVGGDIQIGPAISARFRSDDCPEARFEINVYATAKTYMDVQEPDPECPHMTEVVERYGDSLAAWFAPMPEEHLTCSWKPGTVDVEAQYSYRMDGRMDGDVYDSSDEVVTYAWVGSDLGYRVEGLPEEVRLATEHARRWLQDQVTNINKYLVWDGRTRPND